MKITQFVKENRLQLIKMAAMVAFAIGSGERGIVEAATTQMNAAMPWTHGVSALRAELTGPLPTIGATIACAASGAMMAFGETQGITKKAIQGTFGMGIAVGAGTLVNTLTGSDVSGCLF